MWIGCIQLPLTTILTVVILSIAIKADGSTSEACHYVYTRQPPSHLSCTPRRSLVLLCEAHSTWQAFRLLWYAVPPHADSPIQLPNLLPNNITVKMMPVAGHSHHVISTLSLPLSLHHHLRQIYCQIELYNGSLLQPSQIMVLDDRPLAKLELCTQKSLLAALGGSKCAYYFMPPGHRRAAKQLEPQRSTIPTEMLARPPAALYAIVAIIVLFVIVIISLTIIVVLLYRKKCVQMEISSPGPRGGTNTYDGFDMDRPTSSEHTLQEGSEPSFTSKRPLSARSPSPHHSQPALSQADFALHPGPPACPLKHHLTASISASPALNVSVDEQVLRDHKRPKPKMKFKVLESSLGNYECSPTYQSSSAVTFATPTLGKYSGDYERDPNYMRRLRPLSQQVLKEEERCSNVQSGQDTRVDIECGERTEDIVQILCNSKYRGNYERSPIYMEKLLQSGEVETIPSCHQEYTTLATTAKHSPRPYTETFAHPHSSEAMSEHPFQPSEAITDQSSDS